MRMYNTKYATGVALGSIRKLLAFGERISFGDAASRIRGSPNFSGVFSKCAASIFFNEKDRIHSLRFYLSAHNSNIIVDQSGFGRKFYWHSLNQ